MAFDHHPALGIRLEKGHQRLEMPPGARAEVGFAGRKQDVAVGAYQALIRLLGLEGGEFLLSCWTELVAPWACWVARAASSCARWASRVRTSRRTRSRSSVACCICASATCFSAAAWALSTRWVARVARGCPSAVS
jgi:hypothetical protein